MAAAACPWANRSTIVRRLLGLESAISLGFAGPTHDWRSWQMISCGCQFDEYHQSWLHENQLALQF